MHFAVRHLFPFRLALKRSNNSIGHHNAIRPRLSGMHSGEREKSKKKEWDIQYKEREGVATMIIQHCCSKTNVRGADMKKARFPSLSLLFPAVFRQVLLSIIINGRGSFLFFLLFRSGNHDISSIGQRRETLSPIVDRQQKKVRIRGCACAHVDGRRRRGRQKLVFSDSDHIVSIPGGPA